jgi:hypothetical protein
LLVFRCGWDEDEIVIASSVDYWSCQLHGKHNWRKQVQAEAEVSLPQVNISAIDSASWVGLPIPP